MATLVNASAVGFYGNTKDRVVDENDRAGSGFLARLCEDWEAATLPAQYGGARVVLARTGLVFSPAGGALGQLRPLFRTGLGARLGSGRQYMSWITLEDEVRALLFAISNTALSGPVNMTGPAPVTNAEFTTAFGRAVNRPTPLMLPGFAVRAALGEFADEGLLTGQRAIRRRSSAPVFCSTTTRLVRRSATPPPGETTTSGTCVALARAGRVPSRR